MSKRGVIVTAPTVTATMNAYLFLKNIIFRLLSSVFKRGTRGNEILKTINKIQSTFKGYISLICC